MQSVREHSQDTESTTTTGFVRRILIADDEENLRHVLAVLLRREGYEVGCVATGEQALLELASKNYDMVLADIRMPKLGGLELVDEVRKRGLNTTVILMTAFGGVDTAIEAMKRGAYDYISKPFRPDEVVLVLRKAEERERLFHENLSLKQALTIERTRNHPEHETAGFIADTAIMQDVLRTVRKIAEYKTTVLITGESGTGKELIARAIHDASPRARGPFVAVNCGAIPEMLLESELFGHKKGAFTDAVRDKRGLFEAATTGTLFLDEIGELPLGPQVKLLRVLQEQTVRPVGSETDEKIDVRVLAATVRDLAKDVAAGSFREDLYYRLNVIQLQLPPLRDRLEEIPGLVNAFIARTNAKLRTKIKGLAPDTLKLFFSYGWPGNVRELQNVIERAMVLCESDLIETKDLPDRFHTRTELTRQTISPQELSIKKTVRVVEEDLIRRALKKTGGNRTNASKILEISHRSLLYKIKEYEIDDE